MVFHKHRRPLTDKETAWLKAHFKHTKNDEIMAKLGITHGHLHDLARTYGLKKTGQFMKEAQRNATQKSVLAIEKMRREDPERYERRKAKCCANLEWWKYGLKKGESLKSKMTEEAWQEAVEKGKAKLRAMRARDRARVAIGLRPLTKLPLGYPSKQRFRHWQRKHHLVKKFGYIMGEGRTMYYDENTRRTSAEHLYVKRHGFKFEEYGAVKEDKEVKLPPSWADKQGGFDVV